MLTFLRLRSRKPKGAAPAPPNWPLQLQSAVSELARVNHSTEADFLAIGEKLSSFVSAARGISTEANAIKDSLSGDTGRSLCQGLSTVLDDTVKQERDAEATRELNGMRQAVAGIRQSLSTFEQVGPSFQVMAALARIETAHLGSAGLDVGHLADEFRSAGEGIQGRVQHILNGTTMLETRIDSALKEVAQFDQRSHHALHSLLATATDGLNEFQARQEKIAQTAYTLGAESAEIAKAISNLVTSIQFHDITRQQIEHLVDSLHKLDGSDGLSDTTLALVHLQLAQLDSASDSFSSAVSRMDRDLDEIAGRIVHMLSESANLLTAGGAGSENSFYTHMEACFHAIVAASADRAVVEAEFATAFAGLEETIQSLKDSAREIHRVELQLRWLAINAAISAAHIGTSGEPLEAIAAAMHRLLADCETSSRAADASIRSISDMFRSAAQASIASQQHDSGSLLDGLRNQIEQLRFIEEGAGTRGGELACSASRLSAEVEQLRREFSAGRLFGSAAANCTTVLRSIQELAGPGRAKFDEAHLDALKQQYTMQSERDIHEAIFAPAETETGPASPDKEFDDNVELF